MQQIPGSLQYGPPQLCGLALYTSICKSLPILD